MKPFMDENFLLPNAASERLYHEYAKDMPIYDYHAHLPIEQIVEDTRFENITQVWLYRDHYKWRAMWACGISDEFASGYPVAADDYARFEAWAKVIPQTIGNPLYHWSHLELKRYFGVDELLSPATARRVYDRCAEKLSSPEFSVRSIIRRSNVSLVCTTDDPTDDLTGHVSMSKESWGCKVYPAWRPDRALFAHDAKTWNEWLAKLEAVSGMSIGNFDAFLDVLWSRHQFFHDCGCRLSDYGIERPYAADFRLSDVKRFFGKARAGESLAGDELEQYRSAVLLELLKMDAKQHWTQQLHLGALRNNNSRMYAAKGPDAGYDSIGQFDMAAPLVRLFDRLESEGLLARTIVYVVNPNYNDVVASILASFQDGKTAGKMQFGTAWWHNDHKDGMNRQFSALASIGLISRFVGMLTDSRSFLSYPRHEYFRRLLCAKFGTEMENGELPGDFEMIGSIVKDICFNNAKNYFGMPL